MAVLAQSAEICYTEPERKCFPVRCDCHIHMVLDGADWKRAIARHSGGVDEVWVRRVLETYQKLGFTYLRDGGDRWSVGAKARSLAGEYGITYRTPLSPLCAQGHYGGFIGEKYENLSQYAAMVTQKRAEDADFIKIMISGLMDFDRFGVLTEDGLPPETIRELIHIAHEEGFAVMAHANGARTVEAAALAGVDSVEHGAYLDTDALRAMRENGTVWVPTLSTIGNLRGTGRFDEAAVAAILESAMENVAAFAAMGGLIAPGTDAGAWAVPHGSLSEYALLEQALGENAENVLSRGAAEAVFVDKRADAVKLVRDNLELCGLLDRAQVRSGDSLAYLRSGEKFDLIFLDPPYASGLLEQALSDIAGFDICREHGIIMAESPADAVLPALEAPYRLYREYRYGKIKLTVYHRQGSEE